MSQCWRKECSDSKFIKILTFPQHLFIDWYLNFNKLLVRILHLYYCLLLIFRRIILLINNRLLLRWKICLITSIWLIWTCLNRFIFGLLLLLFWFYLLWMLIIKLSNTFIIFIIFIFSFYLWIVWIILYWLMWNLVLTRIIKFTIIS